MQLREISIDCIIKVFELELKNPSFLYYYNLILQDELFCMACQSFFLSLFYVKDGI